MIDILDTTSFEARKAWEEELSFHSIRLDYEEMLNLFWDEEPYVLSRYKHLADFSGDYPVLIDYLPSFASVLNKDGLVTINGLLGSVRQDGCYWSTNQDKEVLEKLIKKKKHDPENGLFVFKAPKNLLAKSCSDGIVYSSFTEYKSVSNGNSRGSTKINGFISYSYFAIPSGATHSEFKIEFIMGGTSQRRGRRKWKDHRQNHTFHWDFVVDHEVYVPGPGPFEQTLVSSTPMFFSGQETHNNNLRAENAISYNKTLEGKFM